MSDTVQHVVECRYGEQIHIGDYLVVCVAKDRTHVKVGVEAPRSVPIRRSELLSAKEVIP